MLEKILEELNENKNVFAIRGYVGYFVPLKVAEDIIRKHMKDDKCGECSRRKWYQKGYEDGKKDNDGWIPCEERLPEEAGTYIINALTGERNIVTFAKWQNRYKRFDMTGARTYWKIIAWRPLPDPYRPERSKG